MSEEQGKAPHAIWQPLGAPALIGDPIVQCLMLIIVTSAVFLAFPGIDSGFRISSMPTASSPGN